ncbi:WD40 repeat domain-containing protein [Streptomyces sp. H39-S7]|uniref:WD40 repeat domain-containing protein n=1 Tax=Streptomyces sp. H39-S7 TaxID=3004357 RepID=UPI0022AEECEC|nr:hypothetical protein [Streptomyces sp. H39-S7]MCZ4120196.1 hypothetical protein [Streptomyces sp. H39-S7]
MTGPATGYAESLVFSPNGQTLASSNDDGTVRLWNIRNRAHPIPQATLTGPTSYVFSVAFSPDGRTLAADSTDSTIWLWDIERPAAPQLLATLTGPVGHIYSIAYAPDNRTLAGAGTDGMIHLWNTDAERLASTVCTSAGSPLSPAEWREYVPDLPYNPPCNTGRCPSKMGSAGLQGSGANRNRMRVAASWYRLPAASCTPGGSDGELAHARRLGDGICPQRSIGRR